jgi:membrane protein
VSLQCCFHNCWPIDARETARFAPGRENEEDRAAMSDATQGEADPAPAEHRVTRAEVEREILLEARAEALTLRSELRALRAKEVVTSAVEHMREDRVNVAAGAFAYRWFLSIFPTIIALLGVASLVTLPPSVVVSLIHGVTEALPASAADVFTKAISHSTQRAHGDLVATILASAVALWSAVSGMVIVEVGVGMAYGIKNDRTFLRKRFVALQLLVGGIVLGGGASALTVFGPQLGKVIKDSLPFSSITFGFTWTLVRWVAALTLINLLFTVLYYFSPNRPRSKWRWTSIGSLMATIVWALVSLGFSLYTSDFSSYDRTYGAFAGVAILIFWLFLTGLAILVGGEVNAAIERLGVINGAAVPPPAEDVSPGAAPHDGGA